MSKNVAVSPTYWELERIVAWNFNRLKGKLYNLIEASVENDEQKKALKGLIKGFSNEEYKLCVKEMRWQAKVLQLLPEGEEYQETDFAEPLENKGGVFGE